MQIRQAYRYELKPNVAQRVLCAKHVGVARFAWNWGLAGRIARFESEEGEERFSDAMKDHKAWNVFKREHAAF
ncbi:MAG: helix-turn-helix domain-containing protein, partial [Planctomycetota bacterium]